jgi:gliding motility-associated-like protein
MKTIFTQYFSLIFITLISFCSIAQLTPNGNSGSSTTVYTNAASNNPIYIWCADGLSNNTASLTANAPTGSGPFTYSWFFHDQSNFSWSPYFTQTGTSSTISNLPSDGYRVQIYNTGGNLVACYIAWVWNMNSDVTANNTPTACNASNLSGVVSVNGAFSYYNPPPPESLINASTQITVCFSANHTYVSDLGFYLVGPAACGSPTIAVMPHPELINASNLCCCNSGDNLSNLCFTTNPLGNINPCTAAVPLNGTYSGYSSSFGNNVTINWSSLFGCNAAEGGWRVQIHDCIGQDVGALTNASITFSNLTSICGSPTSITYSSGAINSIINDNSCTAASASIFQVPITPNLTTPITINSSTTYLWTADQTVAIPNASSSLNTSVSTIPNGTTNFTLTATISYGSTVCTNNAVTTFNNTCCTATADAGADLSFCTGANSQLGTPALPNMTYLWSPATGLTDATIAQPTVTLINSGSTSQNTIYTLTVTNTVDGGCNDVDDIVVTVNPNITPTGLACYETAMFNTITCVWDVTGTQPVTPTLACYEIAIFNTTTCDWDVTGTQPVQPTVACYETAVFNTTSCTWLVTGTQPPAPVVACYETATWNGTIGICTWEVTGSPPSPPTFIPLGSYCSGAPILPLPTNSTNGISGTWSPAINNTSTTTYTFTPSAGQCATNQIMIITIDPSTTTGSVTTSICEGSSYTWPANGLTYSTAQNGLSFVTGCNTATLNLNLLPNVINAVVDTACGEYLFGTNLLDISGIYVDTFLTTNNCDSIVTLDLTIFEDSSVTYINACDSVQWNGVWYYNDTIVTTAGLYTSIPFGGSTVNSSGQEGNIWYFGNNAGITFETNPPSALNNGAISTFEGCATFSDNQGNLLFYTDGMFVYNKLHQQMPNGFGLLGNPSSAQSGVIVPKPGSQTDFYVFTVAAEGGSNGFRYSELDMTLDGGLGDVIIPSKNTLLFAPSAEKVAAVAHANGVNYWVISHGINNNSYYAYLLDFNGINNPVISNVGQIESNPGWGYLASSIDGTKLASAMCNQGFELLDFNNQTGVVSNPILLNNPGSAYGISFSPNSQILYGCEIAGGQIYQWDLNAGSSSSIISSMQVIGTGQGSSGGYKGGAIQQGRDGKLYIPQFNQPYLSCINNPNQLGNGCNLQHFAIDLQGNNAQLGLPTFFSSIFESPPAGCDSVATAVITITPTITPTFSIVGPYCIGEAIPDLPLTSSNGITGTWSPAIDNTATTLYTFTPNTGQCALTQTLIITIFPNTIPTFAAVGPYCTGEAIADLSLTSTNGINGTWSPAIDNTATTTYTFTPTSTATPTCATTAALTITITPNTSPIFTAVGPYCSGAIIPNLPLTSTNGISGAWSPAIDNTAITTYTFTPTSSATPTCATTADLTITITPNTYPIFTAVGPYCSGSIIPNLSLTSTNGITGTWSPAIINTTTTPYTFTPTSAATPICATTAALTITINPTPTVSFIPDATIGCLPFETSLTNTTPNAQNCVWTISNGIGLTGCGTIPVIFSNDGCYDVTLTTTVSNGCTSSLTMNNLICVENNPIASFSTSTNELSILNTEVLFDNTSTGANTYQWYFGVNDAESSLENPIFTFPNDYENGQYEVILIATSTIGCTDTAETIIQINEELLFYIPNTFTPDGDVYNQTFKPVFTSGFDPYNYEMLIFNRWGEILFETHDVTYGWDGKYALKNCQEGIYSYKITFKNPILDERKVVCGSINLLK